MRKHGKAGENMQMKIPVGRAYEEEMPRPGPVGRAEENRLLPPGVGDERIFEHVRIVVARMEKRRSLAYRGGSRLLPCKDLPEESVAVVNKAAFFRKIGHVADNASLGLCAKRKIDAFDTEKIFDEPPVLRDSAATAFVRHRTVAFGQIPFPCRKQMPLHPFIDVAPAKIPFAASQRGVDFSALRRMAQFVRVDVRDGGRRLKS